MAQGILDAFEAMTLGPGAPGQHDPTMDPAYYPRPTGEDAEAAGQPPPPFQPGNCDPRFMRLTCNAIPSQQARLLPVTHPQNHSQPAGKPNLPPWHMCTQERASQVAWR